MANDGNAPGVRVSRLPRLDASERGATEDATEQAAPRTAQMFPRARLEHWAAHPRLPYDGMPPRRLRRDLEVRRGRFADRPLYRLRAHGAASPARLLFLHGGAYVLEFIPSFHWPAAIRSAEVTGREVVVPIYPLAPEHTHREVVPWCLGLYRQLLAESDAPIGIIGDSAGGGLALALAHAVRDAGLPAADATVLVSPWLHLGLPDDGVLDAARADPVLRLADLRAAALRYAGGDPLDTVPCSPAVGPLTGLPPITLFTGTCDVLNPDARALRDRAEREGVPIDFHERDGGVHCWPYQTDDATDDAGGRAWAVIARALATINGS